MHSFHHKPGFPLDSYNIYCDLWELHPIPERLSRSARPVDVVPAGSLPRLDEFPTKMSLSPRT
ncbi:hypothetical protein [Paenibacillus elgii]|uniref:hypothetical protein n=1 Tax=Paenibacillus elgii TaxID=189691 RepID=UPI0013D76F87